MNPLNEPRAFANVCSGAGGAFGITACVTLGEEYSADFARLSIIAIIIAAALYITLWLMERSENEETYIKNSSSPNANQTELENTAIPKNCNVSIADFSGNVKEVGDE